MYKCLDYIIFQTPPIFVCEDLDERFTIVYFDVLR